MDYFTSLAEWAHLGLENTLSVVIRAHNKEGKFKQTIEPMVPALEDAKIQYQIRIVNDNSSGDTVTELEEIKARLSY